ncbi:MAG TPA: porphobilinogen synthase [Candidatus Polarisedimenticolia bacterium]|jgi:porphobilinogen synthase|nr:porphobilinogen synthase [Candidatus Polarisedimenticolia bacterium]
MGFPVIRPRRLRRTEALRAFVREASLTPGDLVMPLFVLPGKKLRRPIGSMPGQFQLSVDEAVREAKEAAAVGVPAVILFGLPETKDARASGAWAKDGIVQQATRAIKEALPSLLVLTDVCLCEYTDHGHCGLVEGDQIANDPTLEVLAQTAVSQAEAGADVVAPSDMMDGRVAAIRQALDAAGKADVAILSYAAKYASAFYGPFREAAESTPKFGDRRTHQMDPGNAREALREVFLDLGEGADMVLVKPALPYLDVLRRVRDAVHVPVGAYHVSGEYAMIEAAAKNGWIDRDRVILESLVAIRRAGADFILTYHARDAARLLT